MRRERLDALVLSKAIEHGADLQSGFTVTQVQKQDGRWQVQSADGRCHEARALVIADGSGSPWPESLGLGPSSLHCATTTSVRLEGRGALRSARQDLNLAWCITALPGPSPWATE